MFLSKSQSIFEEKMSYCFSHIHYVSGRDNYESRKNKLYGTIEI